MAPQNHNQQRTEDFPTSPWTEAYQATYPSWAHQHDEHMQAAERDDDTQQPTHDALSEIYNRGY